MKTVPLLLSLASVFLFCACHSTPNDPTNSLEPMARVELEGEWTIATIDGAPVLEEGDAFLGFGQDGRISGNTSVNRLLGAWSLEQGQLSLGQLGSTRMAGPPKLMEQEGRLLAALERVASAERDDRGHLHLRSADGQVLMTASPRR